VAELDEAFTMAAGHADKPVPVKNTDHEIDIGVGILAEAFCQHVSSVDLLGRSAEDLGMVP